MDIMVFCNLIGANCCLKDWGFALKEKLKAIKEILKTWHSEHFENLDAKMVDVKVQLNGLNIKGEDSDLMKIEVMEGR